MIKMIKMLDSLYEFTFGELQTSLCIFLTSVQLVMHGKHVIPSCALSMYLNSIHTRKVVIVNFILYLINIETKLQI